MIDQVKHPTFRNLDATRGAGDGALRSVSGIEAQSTQVSDRRREEGGNHGGGERRGGEDRRERDEVVIGGSREGDAEVEYRVEEFPAAKPVEEDKPAKKEKKNIVGSGSGMRAIVAKQLIGSGHGKEAIGGLLEEIENLDPNLQAKVAGAIASGAAPSLAEQTVALQGSPHGTAAMAYMARQKVFEGREPPQPGAVYSEAL